MGGGSLSAGAELKTRGRRLFKWGMYKRDEFVQTLEELRKLVVPLLTYAMFENTLPGALGTAANCEPLRLIDALNREIVCSISMCDTWEVSGSHQSVALGGGFAVLVRPRVGVRGFSAVHVQSIRRQSVGQGWEVSDYE